MPPLRTYEISQHNGRTRSTGALLTNATPNNNVVSTQQQRLPSRTRSAVIGPSVATTVDALKQVSFALHESSTRLSSPRNNRSQSAVRPSIPDSERMHPMHVRPRATSTGRLRRDKSGNGGDASMDDEEDDDFASSLVW